MDSALLTATAAVLVDVDWATYSAEKCINVIPSAHRDLLQVRVELRTFHYRLRRLQEDEIPRALRPTFIGVINGCSGVCKRIGDILVGCGEDADPSRCWALVSAPTEIKQLKLELVQGRRTMDIVDRVLDPDYHDGLLSDIGDLRRVLLSESSPLYALIISCLDAVEIYISRHAALNEPITPMPISSTSPPVQERMVSPRRSSLQDWETRDSAIGAMSDFDSSKGSGTTSPSYSSQYTIDSEHRLQKSLSRTDRSSGEPQGLQHSPLRLNSRSPRRESQTVPIYALFPPASAPPARALPPIPPLRSPRRPSTNRDQSLAGYSPSSSPTQAWERAYSDLRSDAEFSSLSSMADHFSESPKEVHIPLRSSSYLKPYEARPLSSPKPETISEYISAELDIVPLRHLEIDEMEAFHGSVYSINTSAKSTFLASRHGKFHVKLWDLRSSTSLTTLKVPFYIQIQPRSRDYFVRSHVILSETLNLIGIAAGFGQSIEIWNWAKKKKLQTIHDALRWAAVRSDIYESSCRPLATYSEDEDAIKLYPVAPKKKPFGKPRIINLRKSGLPHLPKMPELAFSPTGPLLLAAAGPRPPRPGNPPPAHAALLMVWQLDGDEGTHTPYKFFQTTNHPEIENSLPLHLETYGSVAVSIWEHAKFRTRGRPGMWQVEPITVTERVVLVWDFSGPVDKTTTYSIPAVLACISSDCRFVAYCDPGGRDGGDPHGALVVLDATGSGQELWRLDGWGKESVATPAEASGRTSRWGRRSTETKRSAHRSDKSSMTADVEGLELLAQNLNKVTELTFSGDGSQLLVGDRDGEIDIYELRLEGLHKTMSVDSE